MKRYTAWGTVDGYTEMKEDPNGAYVLYADVQPTYVDVLPDAYMVLASGKSGELAATAWIGLADAEQDALEWRINGKETEIVPLFASARDSPLPISKEKQ